MNALFENLTENYRPVKWANDDNYYGSYLFLRPEADSVSRVMDARFYVSRSGNTLWCRVWLRVGDKEGYGTGAAGGWGYDRESSAFVNALKDMGINLNNLRKATIAESGSMGIQGGVGMSYIIPRLKRLLPDGDKLVDMFVGS